MRHRTPDGRRAGWRLVIALIAIALGIALIGTSLHQWVDSWETQVEPTTTQESTPSPAESSTSTPPPATPTPSVTLSPTPTETKPALPQIDPADIVSVSVTGPDGAVRITETKASGPIVPTKTRNCHEAELCYDPPLMEQVAWAGGGSLPQTPLTDTVYVLGHSWRKGPAAFNKLPTVRLGDFATITTTKGIFTFMVDKTETVPFADLAGREDIWGVAPGRLVMMTCQSNDEKTQYLGTLVVTGHLVDAKRR